jgi:serine/threonine protein kinase
MSPTNQLQTVGDRYRLGDLIGQGGMGEVYAAHDLRLEREVALKLLRADLADQDTMRDRVLAEARLAARLTHPNVVAVLDTGEEDGRPYVVMERLSGRTLHDELAGGTMSEDRVRDVGLQVLRALAAAHEIGIVHRDMKPGNVLDAGVGTWKVGDFGIAKWLHADETLTGTGELLGSPSYLAPERIEGGEAVPASDLYAVGVLLYEALCGRRPYEATDPVTLATQIREGSFEPVRAVCPDADLDLAAVIERAMRREPDDRFVDAHEMSAALTGEETTGDVDRTAVLAPSVTTDGATTIAMPKLERTARLPVQPAAAPEPEPDAEGAVGSDPAAESVPAPEPHPAPEPQPVSTPAASPSRRRPWIGVAAPVVAIALVTVLALVVFTGRDRPGGAERRPALPAQLEDALTRLEESVRR